MITKTFPAPNCTVANLCFVTSSSRVQSANPLLVVRNGNDPSMGTLQGPGGSFFLLITYLNIKKTLRNKTSRELIMVTTKIMDADTGTGKYEVMD